VRDMTRCAPHEEWTRHPTILRCLGIEVREGSENAQAIALSETGEETQIGMALGVRPRPGRQGSRVTNVAGGGQGHGKTGTKNKDAGPQM